MHPDELAIVLDTDQSSECLLAMPNASHYAALKVIHNAISILASWANTSFLPATDKKAIEEVQPFIKAAQEILNWSDNDPAILQIVFDQIRLSAAPHHAKNYRPAWALEVKGSEHTPRIPYPQTKDQAKAELEALKGATRKEISRLDPDNLVQLTLFLEKFGSHVSVGEPDIALIDQARSTAALAAALAQNPPDEKLALIGGDLMGVQKFIYTISSEGALKSLRARSFYLELATEEIVQQLLIALDLPRTNVIYAGASKFYLLVAETSELEGTLERIQRDFNDWLLDTFQRKVFLAIALEIFPAEQLKNAPSADAKITPLTQIWQAANDQLAKQANRKFVQAIDRLLEPQPSYRSPCKVCHRDDVPEDELKRLNELEADSVLVCCTCQNMFRLGDRLPEVKALVRSTRKYSDDDIQIQSIFYHPIEHFAWKPNPGEIVFQINNWNFKDYRSDQFTSLLLGQYFKAVPKEEKPEQQRFITASEMAEASEGIKRVGYLRMDVDRLSQIFSKGLGKNYTLPRLASLSRQMTYFFKVYLNSLAEYRGANFTDHQNADGVPKFKTITPLSTRTNLLFIYAGGDDLFVSGAWNEAVEFAFDVYQAFRAYTGQHPDITLSAGVCLASAKFPLYQAADEAGDIEKSAKGNGRDSLGLFNAALKWDEWLGNWNPKVLKVEDLDYLNSPVNMDEPALFGVLPFIEYLYREVGQGYTRSFVRNLLNTAQLQEAKIKEKQENLKEEEKKIKALKDQSEGTEDELREAEDKFRKIKQNYPKQERDLRYYLHLPKVAYTLARLPKNVLANAEFRQSLKSPYNAPYFRAIATWIELLNR